ncbi:arylacetamide deacetylase-like 4 [Tiliqua scincoides]|uniref:arylacetamide deacetylase-like 4 n=1 Tax=Tiliqua scincoides TaxID=71010 RepID=UPI0034634F52
MQEQKERDEKKHQAEKGEEGRQETSESSREFEGYNEKERHPRKQRRTKGQDLTDGAGVQHSYRSEEGMAEWKDVQRRKKVKRSFRVGQVQFTTAPEALGGHNKFQTLQCEDEKESSDQEHRNVLSEVNDSPLQKEGGDQSLPKKQCCKQKKTRKEKRREKYLIQKESHTMKEIERLQEERTEKYLELDRYRLRYDKTTEEEEQGKLWDIIINIEKDMRTIERKMSSLMNNMDKTAGEVENEEEESMKQRNQVTKDTKETNCKHMDREGRNLIVTRRQFLSVEQTTGTFLVKLGVCGEFTLPRLVFDGIPASQDSNLLIKDLVFDDVPVRVYWPKTPVAVRRKGFLYLHGGMGLLGSFRGYGRVCHAIVRESDSVVVCVRFRLAPEHPYPTQIRDCLTAAIQFLKHAEDYGVDPNRIIIGGDSSGGTYAAAVAQELVSQVDLPRLRAQILIYLFLQALDFNLPSYQQYHSAALLCKRVAIKFGFIALGKQVRDLNGVMKNAHVPEAMRVKYSKWISADLIPAEFKVKASEPPVLAPFSEELYEVCKAALETRFSPLLADDELIRQLPETFLLTCEYDILRDDGLLYKKRLEDHGVPVTWCHAQDGFHGILLLFEYPFVESQSSKDCFKCAMHFLQGI